MFFFHFNFDLIFQETATVKCMHVSILYQVHWQGVKNDFMGNSLPTLELMLLRMYSSCSKASMKTRSNSVRHQINTNTLKSHCDERMQQIKVWIK